MSGPSEGGGPTKEKPNRQHHGSKMKINGPFLVFVMGGWMRTLTCVAFPWTPPISSYMFLCAQAADVPVMFYRVIVAISIVCKVQAAAFLCAVCVAAFRDKSIIYRCYSLKLTYGQLLGWMHIYNTVSLHIVFFSFFYHFYSPSKPFTFKVVLFCRPRMWTAVAVAQTLFTRVRATLRGGIESMAKVPFVQSLCLKTPFQGQTPWEDECDRMWGNGRIDL